MDGRRPVYRMDSQDASDLWTLVRASQTLEGFLFAPLKGVYGARALDRANIGAMLAERSARHLQDENSSMPA